MNEIMKAISLWQPWASLLACGAKQYETRSWETRHRGPIAIHAAIKPIRQVIKEKFPLGEWTGAPDYEAKLGYIRAVADALALHPLTLSGLPTGSIIATAELAGCHPMLPIPASTGEAGIHLIDGSHFVTRPGDNEFLFGDWAPGRYAWEFANMKLLPEPIPCKGHQGLWNWEAPSSYSKCKIAAGSGRCT